MHHDLEAQLHQTVSIRPDSNLFTTRHLKFHESLEHEESQEQTIPLKVPSPVTLCKLFNLTKLKFPHLHTHTKKKKQRS